MVNKPFFHLLISILLCFCLCYLSGQVAIAQGHTGITTVDLLREVDDFCLCGKGSKSLDIKGFASEFYPRPEAFSDSVFIYKPIEHGLDSGTLQWSRPESYSIRRVGSSDVSETLFFIAGLVYPLCYNMIFVQEYAQRVLDMDNSFCSYNWRKDLSLIVPSVKNYHGLSDSDIGFGEDSIFISRPARQDSSNYEVLTELLAQAKPKEVESLQMQLISNASIDIASLKDWNSKLSSDLLGSYRPELLVDFLSVPRNDSIYILDKQDTIVKVASYDLLIYTIMRSSYLSGLHYIGQVDFHSFDPSVFKVKQFSFTRKFEKEYIEVPLRNMLTVYAAMFNSANYNETIYDYYYCSKFQRYDTIKPALRAKLLGIPAYEPYLEQLNEIFDRFD